MDYNGAKAVGYLHGEINLNFHLTSGIEINYRCLKGLTEKGKHIFRNDYLYDIGIEKDFLKKMRKVLKKIFLNLNIFMH